MQDFTHIVYQVGNISITFSNATSFGGNSKQVYNFFYINAQLNSTIWNAEKDDSNELFHSLENQKGLLNFISKMIGIFSFFIL